MSRVENWKEILKHAWSIRLALVTAIFSAAEVALPFFTDFVPPHTMAILAVLTATGSAIARIVAQPAMQRSVINDTKQT